MLREPEAWDCAAGIGLFASPVVGIYVGGPRPCDEPERAVPEVPTGRPGLFVVDLDGAMIGMITLLDRRGAEGLGLVRRGAGEAEFGYMTLSRIFTNLMATRPGHLLIEWLTAWLARFPTASRSKSARRGAHHRRAREGTIEPYQAPIWRRG